MSAQFAGFQQMMEKSLDKLSELEQWRSSADKAFDKLIQQAEQTSLWVEQAGTSLQQASFRIDALEFRPPPPPPPPPLTSAGHPPLRPPPPPPVRTTTHWLDLNLSPDPGARVSPGARSEGHGDGILGSPPQQTLGMQPIPHPPPATSFEFEIPVPNRSAPYPKMDFPKFDGTNPRLWRDQCENYFEVYAVHHSLKTRFAALNFTGSAALWLQSIERRGRVLEWQRLWELVFAKFDKDQYQLQLRQLDSLKQTGTVADYQKKFEELAHGVLLYNPAFDDTYFVTRFLGGLKEQIRSAIAIHRPPDVDTASALALLQEEELSLLPSLSSKAAYSARSFSYQDKSKGIESDSSTSKSSKESSDDRLSSLKSHRRKNGLCFKCGEKWGPTHKCPTHTFHCM